MAKRRKCAETTERILHACDGLFYANGTRATGVDAIAGRAGVTVRTLYAKFGSKKGLIDAYLARRDAMTLRWFNTIEPEGSPRRRLVAVFDAIGAAGSADSFAGCPFLRTLAEERSGAARDTAIRRAVEHKTRIEGFFAGILGDNRKGRAVLARQITLLLEGAISQIMVHGNPQYAHDARDGMLVLYDAWVAKAP